MKIEPEIVKQLRFEEKKRKDGSYQNTNINIKKPLKENEKVANRYKRILENSPDYIAELDEQGFFIYVNPSMAKSIGTTVDRIIGKSVFDILPSKAAKRRYDIAKETLKKEEKITIEDKRGNRYFTNIFIPTKDEKGRKIIQVIARDITEIKKNEEKIRLSANHFKNLFDSIADPIVIVNSIGKILEMNKKMVEITGYERDQYIGKNAFKTKLLSNKTKKTLIKNLFKRMAGAELKPYEIELITKNGKKVPLELNATKIDYFGKTADLVVFRDIRDRKQMEKELTQSEERFRQIVENSREWVWEVDSNGLYTYASPLVKKILGFKSEEIIGKKHFYDFFVPEEREILKNAALESFEKKETFNEFQNRNVHKNGKIIWLSTSGVPILDEDNNLIGYRGADKDITEMKKAEDAIKESEEKYRTLVESSPDSIITLDLNGNILSANKTACEILGYTKEELLNSNFTDLAAIDDKDLPRYYNLINNIINGKKIQPFELLVNKKDGEKIYVETHISPMKKNDELIGIQAITRVIQDRKIAEEKLREIYQKIENLNKELEKKVRERTIEVETLLKQKDEFINQLGHDLKNPLTPLITLLPMVKKKVDDPELKKMLDIITRNTFYMKNLVIKTLKLAKLNSPNTKFDFEKINLNDRLNQVANQIKNILDEKHIKLENKIGLNLNAYADVLRFDELLNNILSNSIKYSYKGGKITVNANDIDNMIQISITDNGIGMTKEQINNIFNEFYKVDQSRKDFESSGLGLPICQKIVEKHGGKIWVESDGPNKGTTFHFTLRDYKCISNKN